MVKEVEIRYPAYLIRGPSAVPFNPGYRGTDRFSPYYDDQYEENHEFNQNFLSYVDSTGEGGAFFNRDEAQSFLDRFDKYQPDKYELIKVSKSKQLGTENEFLGYDISYRYKLSQLSGGLSFTFSSNEESHKNVRYPLLRVMQAYFRPLLNVNGLFDDYQVAQLCLDYMRAYEHVFPNAFDDPSLYEVVLIEKVMFE
jgi:hypothetical protein